MNVEGTQNWFVLTSTGPVDEIGYTSINLKLNNAAGSFGTYRYHKLFDTIVTRTEGASLIPDATIINHFERFRSSAKDEVKTSTDRKKANASKPSNPKPAPLQQRERRDITDPDFFAKLISNAMKTQNDNE